MVKKPEFKLALDSVQMDFCYTTAYKTGIPDAYERILFDAFQGSQFLFVRSDSMLEQWHIVDAIKKEWQKYPLELYPAGSNGPKSQHAMLKKSGRRWWEYTKE